MELLRICSVRLVFSIHLLCCCCCCCLFIFCVFSICIDTWNPSETILHFSFVVRMSIGDLCVSVKKEKKITQKTTETKRDGKTNVIKISVFSFFPSIIRPQTEFCQANSVFYTFACSNFGIQLNKRNEPTNEMNQRETEKNISGAMRF